MRRNTSDDPKTNSLREDGTLNPRPKSVSDPLFASNDFFDPRDLVQVKYEMVRRAKTDGHSVSDAAKAFGFSRPAFYQAKAALDSGGLGALVPMRRGPKKAHKLTDEVMAFVRELRQMDPALRTAEIATDIKQRFDIVVHPRTIERGLDREKKKL
jgi:transposase